MMKARKILYLAIVASILSLAIALPALADDGAIPMWIQRNRMTSCGGGPGPDRVIAKVHIFDANRAMVTGAAVSAEWTLPDGSTLVETIDTDSQGTAAFRVFEGRGDYQICVTGVVKDGWQYDPSLNRDEVCSSVHV